MARHSASIKVTREVFSQADGEDIEQDVVVEVEGEFQYYGSANPNERGYHLADWWVVSPKDFKLTPDEGERAEQALYDNR